MLNLHTFIFTRVLLNNLIRAYGCVCSDLQGIKTNARKDGTGWILNGSKVFITNGSMADVVIVVAVTNPSAKTAAHGISLFLVEEGMEGFKKGKKLKKIGLKAQVCMCTAIKILFYGVLFMQMFRCLDVC